MPLYNVEAVNIRSRSIGEADKIVTLFSRQHGKIRAIAKGARRPTSKFGGRLEIFTYNQLLLATAKTLDIISQCETIESFYRLREGKEKLNAGVYMLRLVDMVTEDRQKNVELFDLLLDSLFALQESKDANMVSRAFEVRLCDIEGFLPSEDMLEKKFKRLPLIVSKLRSDYGGSEADLTQKDMEISAKVFKELISDHTGQDIRRLKAVI